MIANIPRSLLHVNIHHTSSQPANHTSLVARPGASRQGAVTKVGSVKELPGRALVLGLKGSVMDPCLDPEMES